MLAHATGAVPFSDWYVPTLEWLWGHLGAAQWGPLIPHALQVLTYALGILVASMQLALRHFGWAVALPWLMLLNPATWILHFVWRDAFMASVLVFAVALGLRLRDSPSPMRFLTYLPAALCGIAAVARPYLLPFAMVLAFALTPEWQRRSWPRGPAVGALIAAFTGALLALALPRLLIPDIETSRAGEAVFALDALHIDCEYAWASSDSPRQPVSPPGLWRDDNPPCENTRPGDFGGAWEAYGDPTGPTALDLAGWRALAVAHPATVVGGRMQHTLLLLTEPLDARWAPNVGSRPLLSTPGAIGDGELVGYPSEGGVATVALAGLTILAPQSAIWWLLGAGLLGLAGLRLHQVDARTLLVLWWPLLTALVTGILAPANDPRYMAPFSILAWLVTLILGPRIWKAWRDQTGNPASSVAAPD
jgi:hypothetical protein